MSVSNIIKKRTAVMLLCGLSLASCANDPDFYDTAAISTYSSELPASGKEPIGTASDTKFIDAVTNFSETLFRGCAKQGENLVLSPLSVIYALTLTANGASGDTLSEFNTLNSGIDVVQMNEYLYSLTERLEKTADSTVDIANSVWADNSGFSLNKEFAVVAQKYYDAQVASVSFADRSTVNTINDWVSDNTDGMIDKAVDEIPAETVMLLINTVLFDGAWEKEYEDFDIYNENFTGYGGTVTDTEFLHSTENAYFKVKNGSGFSKAYKDGYQFVAILPNEGVDIYDFVSTLDISDAIDASVHGSEKVICAIPKFEYDTQADLKRILMDMGLTRAFSSEEAELSGLGQTGENSLYLSSVLQKAKITLNEHGTRAAAVTEIMVGTTAWHEPNIITLNRPFFYMILDGRTEIPLFMGVLAEMENGFSK